MKKVLKKTFFNRPTIIVAQELLGKFLIRKVKKKQIAVIITEIEVYDGLKDKASHASKGINNRTKIMFGHPGIFYIYLIYGMHYILNIVTREKNYPAAILIRGVISENVAINGPGKLTKLLAINNALNGKKANISSGLWFEDRGIAVSIRQIKKTPRVGVDYAGPKWSTKKWRFIAKVLLHKIPKPPA
jgi:DNA-3-methyladenine glycosylase